MTVSREDFEALLDEVRSECVDPRAGIYGPGSISWEIGKESALFAGGGRAALLQLAHPAVAHAVDQHSSTRTDPLGRFQRTFDRVFEMVFGELDDAIRAARRVRRIHEKVTGTIDEDVGAYRRGAAYAANDEAALFWVHATLVDSALLAYGLCIRPLSYEQKDAYYRESRKFARLFGISKSAMPEDWAGFSAYMEQMCASDVIAVGEPAREMAHFLLSSPSRLHRPLFEWSKIATAGMLPERLRREYGLDFGPREQRAFDASFATIRRVYPRLPRRLRYTPAYVRARRRLAGKQGRDPVSDVLEWAMRKSIDTGRADEGARRA